MKHLMIVESPSKAKTIQSYLGKDYQVVATVGHVIDLPKSKLGVSIGAKYEIDYQTIEGKEKVIKELEVALKKTDGTVYLSPDPDREGESIAWQVVKFLKLKKDKYKRVVFHEVTKNAILAAINDPREIDENLVEAQQGRRILDRLVGYPLSQLLWKKIRYGLSAGRVQSVALRLIVEKEKEILAFIPEPYATFTTTYKETGDEVIFTLSGKKGEIHRATPDFVEKYGESLLDKKAKHEVAEYEEKIQTINPPAPFTTSLLQQTANRKFGFTAKMTMKIAQELYQGIKLGGEGLQGLISYMRTDSSNMSEEAITGIRDFIRRKYGIEQLNETSRRYKTKAKVAQEAHEAIRPTHVEYTPAQVAEHLTSQQLRLYTLIWNRAVGTQMKASQVKVTLLKTVPLQEILHKSFKKEGLVFQAKSESVVFAGYTILEKQKDKKIIEIPNISNNTVLTVQLIEKLDMMTSPPGRYNDATLVRELEKKGIGRPSTYANIISTIVTRGYVERVEKFLKPTDIGTLVSDFLVKNFPSVVDYGFTAHMEDQLDEIAKDKMTKEKMLKDFYPAFIKDIEEKDKSIEKSTLTDLGETEKECLKCGTKMRLKIGPYGKYYVCPNEECKYTEPFFDETKYAIQDEVKEKGFLLKKGRFGMYWAHPDYPKVKETLPVLLKEICPICGKFLVERKSKTGRTFIGCSGYPSCTYIKNNRFNKFNKDVKTKGKE